MKETFQKNKSLKKLKLELSINNTQNKNSKSIIKEATDVALSEYLLEQAGVAIVPGSAFGSEGYIRLSFATSMENLKNAISRISKAFS